MQKKSESGKIARHACTTCQLVMTTSSYKGHGAVSIAGIAMHLVSRPSHLVVGAILRNDDNVAVASQNE